MFVDQVWSVSVYFCIRAGLKPSSVADASHSRDPRLISNALPWLISCTISTISRTYGRGQCDRSHHAVHKFTHVRAAPSSCTSSHDSPLLHTACPLPCELQSREVSFLTYITAFMKDFALNEVRDEQKRKRL